jgi:D-xylose transport system substrate-binding protein
MELAAAHAIVQGRHFGSPWPAPDEMAIAGPKGAVARERPAGDRVVDAN